MGYYSVKRKIPTEAGETLLDVARRIKAPVGFEYTPTASGSDTVNLSVTGKRRVTFYHNSFVPFVRLRSGDGEVEVRYSFAPQVKTVFTVILALCAVLFLFSVGLKMPWFIAITALMAAVIYNVPLLVLRFYADDMTENAMKKEAE